MLLQPALSPPPSLGLAPACLLHLHHLHHTPVVRFHLLPPTYISFPRYPRTTDTTALPTVRVRPSVRPCRTYCQYHHKHVFASDDDCRRVRTHAHTRPRHPKCALLRKIHSDPPASHTQPPSHFACASDDISCGFDLPNNNPSQTLSATLLYTSSSARPALSSWANRESDSPVARLPCRLPQRHSRSVQIRPPADTIACHGLPSGCQFPAQYLADSHSRD